MDTSFSSAVRTFCETRAHTRDSGQPRRVEPEQDPLPNHTDHEKDTESDDEDSGNLVEAMHLLTPEDLRPGDEESVDDELALHGSRNEQEQTDAAIKHPQRRFMADLPRSIIRQSTREETFGSCGLNVERVRTLQRSDRYLLLFAHPPTVRLRSALHVVVSFRRFCDRSYCRMRSWAGRNGCKV